MKSILKNLAWTIALILTAISGYAQGKGNLRGVVKDDTGDVLPGAAVVVKGTTLGTATDLNGSYILQGIPAGPTEVVVNYLGYEPITKTFIIKANETETFDFILRQSAIALGDVVISAAIDGQQRALNQQKVADNMMQILSADQMGRFPDLNVSDALRRLSGVTSDGKEVQLRGTPANFTNININGEQIMSSQEGGKRNESMDVIPSDILSSMEVQKTLLPSNDGDAIAGIINMRTGTARSLKPKFSIDLGTGYTFLREKVDYNVKASYAQRFFKNAKNQDGVFGVRANYSYLIDHKGYDRLEAEAWEPYKLTDHATGNVIDENAYVPTDFRYRYQLLTSTRHGASVTLDWTPTQNTKFVLSTIYNQRSEDGERFRNRFRFRDNGNGFYLMENGSIGSERMRNISQITTSLETVRNININLDGETTIGSWKIDGGLFYTKSSRSYESEMDGFQTPEWRAGKKVNGVTIPKKTIIGEIASFDKYLQYKYIFEPSGKMGTEAPDAISRYNLYSIETWNHETRGENFTFRMNAAKNYFIKDYASTFSFGVKGKFMGNKGYVPQDTWNYSVNASEANSLSNLLYTDQVSTKFLNNHLNFGPAPSIDKVHAYVANSANSKDIIINEYTSNSARDAFYYDASEQVMAGYLMNKIQFDKLMFLAGMRIEHTKVDYKANRVDRFVNPNAPIQGDDASFYNDYKVTPVKSSLSYMKVLPNVQFKYDLTDKTIFRLAWTTGYSRPNISELVPKQDVSQDLQQVTIGNPDLKPAYAHNLDLLFEQYLSNVGLVSGGFFYKHIDKFQYLSEGILHDATSPYDGWKVIQSKNGEAAKVYGAEITLNTNLTFLPGFLKNLLFTSNYTFIHSKAVTDQERGALRLPGQAKHTANFALAYSTKRFTIQAAMNYNGSYIMALGSDAERDIWRNGRWQMDINGSVQIVKGLTFWLEAVNVLNSESYSYFGSKDRVYNLQYNGANGRCGFTYKF
ncbi:TonB-dependent receptor [Bacteroides sp.]